MIPQEIEVFNNRLENEYNERLEYRKGILKQIDIEESILDEIVKWKRENFNSEEKLSDSLLQKILLVEETIGSLNREIRKLKEPKEEEVDRFDDVKAYKQRIANEYEDLLEYRVGIIKEVKNEEVNLQKFKEKRNEVLDTIDSQIREEQKTLSEVKLEKNSFVKDLSIKEQELIDKTGKLNEREIIVNDKLRKSEKIDGTLVNEKKEIIAEKETIKLKIKEIEGELSQIEEEKNKLASKSGKISELERDVESNKKIQDRLLSDMVNNLNKSRQSLEGLSKKESYLILKEEELDKESKHIQSQQDTLRRAFQEARNKQII